MLYIMIRKRTGNVSDCEYLSTYPNAIVNPDKAEFVYHMIRPEIVYMMSLAGLVEEGGSHYGLSLLSGSADIQEQLYRNVRFAGEYYDQYGWDASAFLGQTNAENN